jgi:hypothetical protein
VGAGEGRGAAVARQLGSLAREGRAKDEETRTDVGDEEGDRGWEEGDKLCLLAGGFRNVGGVLTILHLLV